jgi:transmembrane sensor
MSSRDDEPDGIEAIAAAWLARRDRGLTAEETAAFAEWLAADSRHQVAVEELALVWGALDDLSASNSQQRAGGVAAAPPARIAPELTPAGKPRASRSLLRWWGALGLAAALAIVAGMSWWPSAAPDEAPARYATAVGGQRNVTLADGSELQLNTDTAVSVRLGARERRVTFERGEAFFKVARDATRPFIVVAGGTEARVLGTAFVVRLRPEQCEVLVTEGHVQFGRRGALGTNLGAQQHAVLANTAAAALQVETLDAEAVARRIAWQSGRLEFKNTPLREVVAEFNRYHRQRLALRDAATGAVPVGGPFEIQNLDGFVRLIENLDVTVVRRETDLIVLGLRP